MKQTPYEVLGKMKRIKRGHTVFEYNSINPFVLELIIGKTIDEAFGESLACVRDAAAENQNDADHRQICKV